jgi:hypothetical protein
MTIIASTLDTSTTFLAHPYLKTYVYLRLFIKHITFYW